MPRVHWDRARSVRLPLQEAALTKNSPAVRSLVIERERHLLRLAEHGNHVLGPGTIGRPLGDRRSACTLGLNSSRTILLENFRDGTFCSLKAKFDHDLATSRGINAPLSDDALPLDLHRLDQF